MMSSTAGIDRRRSTRRGGSGGVTGGRAGMEWECAEPEKVCGELFGVGNGGGSVELREFFAETSRADGTWELLHFWVPPANSSL
jgi:hypothetical protein